MKILNVFHSSLTYGQGGASAGQEKKSVKGVHGALLSCFTPRYEGEYCQVMAILSIWC